MSNNDSGVVGTVSNGEPSGAANEVLYVNHLLGMAANKVELGVVLPDSPQGKPHNFMTSGTEYNGFVTTVGALEFSGVKNVGDNVVPQGYDYVIAKYDGTQAGDVVWFLNGAGMTLPMTSEDIWVNGQQKGYGLSGWTAFTAVPEPTTILAGALLLLPFAASTVRVLRRNRA